ncbi:TOM1L2 [Cordylochernes scorpioides]|uniref:TOM1L2 n=1 Tax=Cordylochernes scorpioides TaxID=51811 RepID=A0ABY6JX10_9ARAC|nr:TOM1L2 [Cordylochernes scorpioides]
MANLLAHLGGNPFATPVGQKIGNCPIQPIISLVCRLNSVCGAEQATDASLASENWAINMEICDIINETDEGTCGTGHDNHGLTRDVFRPKDAVKAIKKRLQQNAGKNYTVVMYTLTVLETCVKNCGKRFHLLVTQKDFVQEMIKLIGPKNDPPTAVQEKVLSLIQTWADTFHANPDMQGVAQVYNDLKLKGIEFPMADMDAMAPIHTPQRGPYNRSLQCVCLKRFYCRFKLTLKPDVQQEMAAPPPPGPIVLSPEQLAKLRSELDMVQSNMRVFGEMLSELQPGGSSATDLQLLDELQKTCRAMQSRLVELIDKVANEQITSELLHVNDELNNLFLRYERFDKKRNVVNKSQPTSPLEQVRYSLNSKYKGGH